MSRTRYLKMRRRYTPRKPKIIFVCESPPASGKYFYDATGQSTEPLFCAMMSDVLELNPGDKEERLRAFQRGGYLLVDATYTPVNKGMSRGDRNKAILKDYPRLTADLGRACRKDTAIVLVKSNVCRLLKDRLVCDGFWIMNNEVRVPFPAYGWQKVFAKRIGHILRRGRATPS